MFVFDDSLKREYTREKALGYKKIVIADDVTVGSEVDMCFENGCIVVKRDNNIVVPDGEEAEMSLLVKEIGLFGNIPCKIELTLCDDAILVTLIEGALDIRIGGEIMMASRGVNVSKYATHNTNDILWCDVNKFLHFVSYWCGANEDYPYDYIYQIELGGTSKDSALWTKPTNKDAFLFDISDGKLAIKEERRRLLAEAEQARRNMSLVVASQRYSADDDDDFDYNPDDYIDDYEDDYEDDDYDYSASDI